MKLKIVLVLISLFLFGPVYAQDKSNSVDVLTSNQIIYSGPYPEPAIIKYQEKDGKEVSVYGYPGIIVINVDQEANQIEVRTFIKNNGGTIIGQTPSLGYYLVKIDAGKEAQFIGTINKDERIKNASPSIVIAQKYLS